MKKLLDFITSGWKTALATIGLIAIALTVHHFTAVRPVKKELKAAAKSITGYMQDSTISAAKIQDLTANRNYFRGQDSLKSNQVAELQLTLKMLQDRQTASKAEIAYQSKLLTEKDTLINNLRSKKMYVKIREREEKTAGIFSKKHWVVVDSTVNFGY